MAKKSVIFERSRNPICVSADIFGADLEATRKAVRGLVIDPMKFAWISEWVERDPSRLAREEHAHVPRVLTPQTQDELIEDLIARDADELGKYICLLGMTNATAIPHTAVAFQNAVRTFAAGSKTDIDLVIVQLGDSTEDYVFCARPFEARIEILLQNLDISWPPGRRVPYSNLNTARLEAQYPSP